MPHLREFRTPITKLRNKLRHLRSEGVRIPEFQMTNPVASGLKTTPSNPPGLGLDGADKSSDAIKALPNWTRDATKAGLAGNDSKSALKPGIGPRPGGLDNASVTPPDGDASKKPLQAQPAGSRLGANAIIGAAQLAFNRDIRNHKMRVIFHPGRAFVMAGIGFIGNLIKGRK